ncbi:twist-related protein-like [Hydractinia symbiolongicarpus]|uniref:twist-related protein-like n=1 Tax=Hydractinia symbiolongicarpus TaxID=13093 RepID=UPI00254B5DC6|nr:twist-related protein-like [Hydractinia symbiolongicarpus]
MMQGRKQLCISSETRRKRNHPNDDLHDKKRYKHGKNTSRADVAYPSSYQNAHRIIANSRERQRTQALNESLNTLRKTIPTLPSDKVSKIQTLRLTTMYITFLRQVLQCNEVNEHPIVDDFHFFNRQLSYAFSVWRMEEDSYHTNKTACYIIEKKLDFRGYNLFRDAGASRKVDITGVKESFLDITA